MTAIRRSIILALFSAILVSAEAGTTSPLTISSPAGVISGMQPTFSWNSSVTRPAWWWLAIEWNGRKYYSTQVDGRLTSWRPNWFLPPGTYTWSVYGPGIGWAPTDTFVVPAGLTGAWDMRDERRYKSLQVYTNWDTLEFHQDGTWTCLRLGWEGRWRYDGTNVTWGQASTLRKDVELSSAYYRTAFPPFVLLPSVVAVLRPAPMTTEAGTVTLTRDSASPAFPQTAAILSPAGKVSSMAPTFSWAAYPAAPGGVTQQKWWWISIERNGRHYYNGYVSGRTTSWTPNWFLPAGTYEWSVYSPSTGWAPVDTFAIPAGLTGAWTLQYGSGTVGGLPTSSSVSFYADGTFNSPLLGEGRWEYDAGGTLKFGQAWVWRGGWFDWHYTILGFVPNQANSGNAYIGGIRKNGFSIDR